MKVHIVIPARLESTRLPRKLLLAETGKPLILHTFENAIMADVCYENVVVATDSRLICEAIENTEYAKEFGNYRAMLTGEFQSGTDRLASIVEENDDCIINLQADEPELSPEHIATLVSEFKRFPCCDMATLATTATIEDQQDDNVVKVRRGLGGYATHFSRKRLPNSYRHIGVYAYSARFLKWFTAQPQTRNETEMSLEQMRALDKGCRIRVAIVDHPYRGIDARKDYDEFIKRYMASTRHERR